MRAEETQTGSQQHQVVAVDRRSRHSYTPARPRCRASAGGRCGGCRRPSTGDAARQPALAVLRRAAAPRPCRRGGSRPRRRSRRRAAARRRVSTRAPAAPASTRIAPGSTGACRSQPLRAAMRVCAGMQARAAQAVLCQPAHDLGAAAVEQVGLDARRGRPWPPLPAWCACRRCRAPRPQPPAIASTSVAQFRHIMQRPRVGHRARIGAVQAIDVGGDEQAHRHRPARPRRRPGCRCRRA